VADKLLLNIKQIAKSKSRIYYSSVPKTFSEAEMDERGTWPKMTGILKYVRISLIEFKG